MKGRAYILIDSTFWIDLINPKNEIIAAEIEAKYDLIKEHYWIVPMPTFYETLRTRFVKNVIGMKKLEFLLKQPNVKILSDENYWEDSLEETMSSNNYLNRKLSLVDMIIRNILKGINIRVDYLVTDNTKDFADICAMRGVEII